MWRKIRPFLPSVVSVLFWVGLQMSGLQIQWLGYVIMGLAVILLLIPSWPGIKQITSNWKYKTPIRLMLVIAVIVLVSGLDFMLYSAQVPKQPNNPMIELVPYPNPISNAPSNTADVTISVRPKPGYQSYIQPVITISNSPDSPPYCDIKLEIHLTGGFKFDETSFPLPDNMQVQAGYAYNDTMILNIQNSP